jgi:hypothetical protein
MKNFKLFIFILIIALGALLGSCGRPEEEIKPVIVKIPEAEKSFVEKLSQFYYGKTIYFKKESDRLAGPSGTVEYRVFQEEYQTGTDMVCVEFKIKSPGTTGFQTLNYKLYVDMVSMGSRVAQAEKDGQKLSEMNLVLMLGNW